MRPMRAITSAQVRDTRDPRIVMPGAIYGQGYRELGSHCFAYIHATEVGGTHPALIEAMGRGALVLYLRYAGEFRGGGRRRHSVPDDLAEKIELAIAMSETERAELRKRARGRVEREYSWDVVTEAYEEMFRGMMK